ncbi:MAG: hypothetical protein KBS41_04440, partial [Oscillospiraceae bacterium]|nr:hypothetical protein [Candidatus Equicaccousia limihippi]
YLFASRTAADGTPFALYGLWHDRYCAIFCENVANENVQLIYNHALVGGFKDAFKPLIKYYFDGISEFEKNARRLYGMNGIFVGSYTTPANYALSCFVPVIIHFTSVGAWLSQMFVDWYRFSGDDKFLKKYVLPFMAKCAEFYLDYMAYDHYGEIKIYPSVSPENTPGNLSKGKNGWGSDSSFPAVKDATIEYAARKELFTNLLELINLTGEYQDLKKPMQKALSEFPLYRINSDGALCEWLSRELDDNYAHRHLSHIYPLFPGTEIKREDKALFYAAKKAVYLREIPSASGWSLAHGAAIFARLNDGDSAVKQLDVLCKACFAPNLFTYHNDPLDRGLTLRFDNPPVQLDALMGVCTTLQMMFLDINKNTLYLLPALPKGFEKGNVNLCFFAGKIKMKWDKPKGAFSCRITIERDCKITVYLPKFCTGKKIIKGKAGQTVEL